MLSERHLFVMLFLRGFGFFLVFKKLWLNYLIFEQRTTGDRDSEINTKTVVALSILIIASSLHANKEFSSTIACKSGAFVKSKGRKWSV